MGKILKLREIPENEERNGDEIYVNFDNVVSFEPNERDGLKFGTLIVTNVATNEELYIIKVKESPFEINELLINN